MSLDQALANFEKSLNRLAEAIENLRALEEKPAPVTAAEVPPPEKKPAAKTKKNPGSDTAAVPPVSANSQTSPAPQPADGPATVPPSAPPAQPGSFLDEYTPATPPATITVDQLRAEAIKCAGVKGEDWVKDVIRTVGNAPKISEIKPEKYAAVMARFTEGMKG